MACKNAPCFIVPNYYSLVQSPDFSSDGRAVLAKGNPVHLKDVAVLGGDRVGLCRVSVLGDDDLLENVISFFFL